MEIYICQISVRDLIEGLCCLADWADSVGFGRTWSLDPRTKACWATPEQSERFSCMGSPATSPPLPKMAVGGKAYVSLSSHGRVHPLLMPGGPELVTQTEATEGETTLFGWSGLAWIACLLPHSAGLECVSL